MAQFLPFVVTILAVVFSDLLTGIGIGLLISVFFVLRTSFHSAIYVAKLGHDTEVRFAKDVSFLHKALLRRAFERVHPQSSVSIDTSSCQYIDSDIMETVEDFVKSAPTKGVRVRWIKADGKSAPWSSDDKPS